MIVVAIVGLAAGFLVWTWAIVWGASAVKTELTHVRGDMNELKAAVREGAHIVSTTLADHGERIAKIEGRLDSDG